ACGGRGSHAAIGSVWGAAALAAEEGHAWEEVGDVSTTASESVRHTRDRLHAPDQAVRARRRRERTRSGLRSRPGEWISRAERGEQDHHDPHAARPDRPNCGAGSAARAAVAGPAGRGADRVDDRGAGVLPVAY